MALLSNIAQGLKKSYDMVTTSMGSNQRAVEALRKQQKAAAASEIEDLRKVNKELQALHNTSARFKLQPPNTQVMTSHIQRLESAEKRKADIEEILHQRGVRDAQKMEEVTMSTGRGIRAFNRVMQAGAAVATIAKVGGLGYADAAVKAARGTHLAGAGMKDMMLAGIKLDQALGMGVEESANLAVELSQVNMASGRHADNLVDLATGIGAVGRVSGVGASAVLEFYDAQMRVQGASIQGAAAMTNMAVEAQKAGLTGKEAFEAMSAHADMELGMDDAARQEYMRQMLGAAATMKAAGINMKEASPRKEGISRVMRDAGLAAAAGGVFTADEIARKRFNAEHGGKGAVQDRADIARAEAAGIERAGGVSTDDWVRSRAAAAAGGSGSDAAIKFEEMRRRAEAAIQAVNATTENALGEGSVDEIMNRVVREQRLTTVRERTVNPGDIEATKRDATASLSSGKTTEERQASIKARVAGAAETVTTGLFGIENTSMMVASASALSDAASNLGGAFGSLRDVTMTAAGAIGGSAVGATLASAASSAAAGLTSVLLPAIGIIGTSVGGFMAGRAIGKSSLGQAASDKIADWLYPTDRQAVIASAAEPAPPVSATTLRQRQARRDARLVEQMVNDMMSEWEEDVPDRLSIHTPRVNAMSDTDETSEPDSNMDQEHLEVAINGTKLAARQLDSLAATRRINEQILNAITDIGMYTIRPAFAMGGSRV